MLTHGLNGFLTSARVRLCFTSGKRELSINASRLTVFNALFFDPKENFPLDISDEDLCMCLSGGEMRIRVAENRRIESF